MNTEKELDFIQHYICQSHRERLRYEFTNAKKRYHGLDRFCHQAEELIDQRTVRLKSRQLEQDSVFQEFLKGKKAVQCTLASPDPRIDGMELPMRDAMDAAEGSFDAVILVGEGFAIVFAEAEKGGRMKYLLVKKTD